MVESIFSVGSQPTLAEVLETRENRASFQGKLVKRFMRPVVAYKLNIPGPVKNNDFITSVFIKGRQDIKNAIQRCLWKIIYEKSLDLKTGPEYFCVVDIDDAGLLKAEMINLEESLIGRIYDIDVLTIQNDGIASIKRTKLGYESRKCFICQKSAMECGGSRIHSVLEMQQKLQEIILNEG